MSRFQPYYDVMHDPIDDSICRKYESLCDDDEYLGTLMDFNEQNGNLVVVINYNLMYVYRLSPVAMECFRRTFPGRICNYEQWTYFVYQISKMMNLTGVGRSKLKYIRIGEFSLD